MSKYLRPSARVFNWYALLAIALASFSATLAGAGLVAAIHFIGRNL